MGLKTEPNTKLLNWWEKASEKIRASTYFEVYLESKSKTYLMVNTTPRPTTIMRVRNDAVNLFETKESESGYVNIKYLLIIKKLEIPKQDKIDNSAPILHLLK